MGCSMSILSTLFNISDILSQLKVSKDLDAVFKMLENSFSNLSL